MQSYLISAAFWLGLCVVAVLGGGMRETLLRPRLGDLRAHQAETLVLCAAFSLLIRAFIGWLKPTSAQAWAVGIMWVVLTLAFEFGLGRLMRKPWAELLADYNVFRGRLWPLVPLTLLLAPVLASRYV